MPNKLTPRQKLDLRLDKLPDGLVVVHLIVKKGVIVEYAVGGGEKLEANNDEWLDVTERRPG